MVMLAAAPAAFRFSGLLVVEFRGDDGSSGDPVMTTSASMEAAPIERGQLRGHRQRSENLQHRQRGRLASLAQGAGGRGTERSPKFARVTHIGRSHARARPARAAWSVQRLVGARW